VVLLLKADCSEDDVLLAYIHAIFYQQDNQNVKESLEKAQSVFKTFCENLDE